MKERKEGTNSTVTEDKCFVFMIWRKWPCYDSVQRKEDKDAKDLAQGKEEKRLGIEE